jgi:hypothetical protein
MIVIGSLSLGDAVLVNAQAAVSTFAAAVFSDLLPPTYWRR